MMIVLGSAPSAMAGPPTHLHNSALDLVGAAPDPGPNHPVQPFNHACGTAVDSQGDVYVAAAGNNAIDVFNPAHEFLTEIADANEPCGLAVNSKGELFVSEQAEGKVVRYKPNAYPFSGAPTYGSPTTIDSSGNAKGIFVDPNDDRLYVAEGARVAVYKADGSFEASIGEGQLGEATGVAVYSNVFERSESADGLHVLHEAAIRYVHVADSGSDEVKIFSGKVEAESALKDASLASPTLRSQLSGPAAGEDFEFGTGETYLFADVGNRDGEGKCAAVGHQACTAGHFYVYDAGRNAVEEFDASGEYLDRFSDPALSSGEPTQVAVDRSGGSGDGTVYVSSGTGPGAKVLAFAPLLQPRRKTLKEPLSHLLVNAQAVATDGHGDVYVAAGPLIHVFSPDGQELQIPQQTPQGEKLVPLIRDPNVPVEDLAVDSGGNVYVLEQHEKVPYYAPSSFPPENGTTYSRHEPIAKSEEFPTSPTVSNTLKAIAVDPGPDLGKDHLFVTAGFETYEYDSAANGSARLRKEVAGGFQEGVRQSLAVDGRTGALAIGSNRGLVGVVDVQGGEEVLTQVTGAGCPVGRLKNNPFIALDQAGGHIIAFDSSAKAREIDQGGGCVAEFGNFTEGVVRPYRIAIDSACALHQPPLAPGSAACAQFDPANGNVYVAFDDPSPEHPPYDVTAFGSLSYSEAPTADTGGATEVGGGAATLNGSVNPGGSALTGCRFEYLARSAFEGNPESDRFEGATSVPCAENLAAIGEGNAPVPVHVVVSGLDPSQRYAFRLVAANETGNDSGDARFFGPPRVAGASAVPVLYTEATLRGSVDSSGLATSYWFEYGMSEGSFEQSTSPMQLQPSGEAVEIQEGIGGLSEGTTYHFRLLVENEAGQEEATGAFQTLQRQHQPPCSNDVYRFGASANLPDCRAYELVTPAQTNGLSPLTVGPGSAGTGFNYWAVAPRGARAGERATYFTAGTIPGFDGNGLLDGYQSERAEGAHPEDGWQSRLFGPSFTQVGGREPGARGVAASQMHSVWRLNPAETIDGTLPAGTYLRGPDGSASAACNPEPLQTDFELIGCGSEGTDYEATSKFVATASSGDLVVFSSSAHLEEGAAPPGTAALYERPAGVASAEVVSTAPSGGSFGAGEDASYVASTEDGSAVLFRLGGALYAHRVGQQTVEVAGAASTFAGVSADGTRVFYARTANGEDPAELFACDTEAGPCAGPGALAPTPVGPPGSLGIFVTVSPEGNGVLFASTEALTGAEENENGEQAEAGSENLYAWEAGPGETHFVGVLDARDFESFGGIANMGLDSWTAAINPDPVAGAGRASAPVRSTPDGGAFVFQSHARLTGYDNEGVGEIYRFEPGAATGERLLCVSCDPSGAPATADAMLEDPNQTEHTETGVNVATAIDNITDDGKRVFFDSGDRLLPEDANHVSDVYEWTRSETGGCTRSGGCLGLISSGQGDTPSFLYGMRSTDGHDVFFHTQEALVGADVSDGPSIYDARVDGGIPEPPAQPACQGDDCQGESYRPGIPGPATTGEGEAAPPRRGCPRGKHRVKGRCVARHPHRVHRRHHRQRRGGR
jgi:hypothetical protein